MTATVSVTTRADLLRADIRARRAWLREAMETSLTREQRDTLLAAAHAMLKLARHRAEG